MDIKYASKPNVRDKKTKNNEHGITTQLEGDAEKRYKSIRSKTTFIIKPIKPRPDSLNHLRVDTTAQLRTAVHQIHLLQITLL